MDDDPGPPGSETPYDDALRLGPETMRQLGYRTVDWLVDRDRRRADEPVLQRASRAEMRRRVDPAAPGRATPYEEILADLETNVLPFRSRIDHPRYLAYIPGSGTWPGALGDLVASAYNIDVGNWTESAGPSQLELDVLSWFADWVGYPSCAAGVLVSGGSAANLTGLACAREALVGAMRDDLVLYVSDQGHSSLARAARLLGFGPRQVRVLPSDECLRMRVDALAAAVEADLAARRRPLAVLAVAGTTNAGAVDPLTQIAELCRRYGVWLHVDAAYGGFAAVTARGRERLAGLSQADSITLDPHKWLYQPFECGALLVRDGRRLREAFEIHPDYLQDAQAADQEVNFSDLGLQLTRMSRALKVWISLRYFGLPAFEAAVDRCLDSAERAERFVRESDDLELLSPATLGIVCFRRRAAGAEKNNRPAGDDLDGASAAVADDEAAVEALNRALVADLTASGRAMVSSTRLAGRYALRICVLNHETRWADVEEVLTWLATAQPEVPAEPGAIRDAREAPVTAGWPFAPPATARLLGQQPLFADVSDDWVDWVATVGRRRSVAAGDTVVRQWDVDRDFYLLLAGSAEVLVSDRSVATLQAGDYFGELAAMDWGASFGYPRLATVRASSDLDLLVLTDAELQQLMGSVPLVDTRIRASAGARLRRG